MPTKLTSEHVLITTHKNHIKGYGFISDLRGETRFGLPDHIIDQYDHIVEIFEENTEVPKYKCELVPELIPVGDLHIFGVKKEEVNHHDAIARQRQLEALHARST